MRQTNRYFRLAFLIACLSISVVLATPLAATAVQKSKRKIKYYRINVNQTFHVRLNQTLKSDSARVGDTFTTTVVDPVYSANGVELVPAGSTITGRVTAVQKAQKDGKPGSLTVSFYSLRLPKRGTE